mmetsp:Transcript_50549/g.94645  ORF Transcript_50549/g.94645 Transcript_50549/m.94645 type:complete len:260 (+) Transcript_50549:1594-2373(+)
MSSKKIPSGRDRSIMYGLPWANLQAPVPTAGADSSASAGLPVASPTSASSLDFSVSLSLWLPAASRLLRAGVCSKRSVIGRVASLRKRTASSCCMLLTSKPPMVVSTAPGLMPFSAAAPSAALTTIMPNSASRSTTKPKGRSSNVATSGGGENTITAFFEPSFFNDPIFLTSSFVVCRGAPPMDLARQPLPMPKSEACDSACTSLAVRSSLNMTPSGLLRSTVMFKPFSIWFMTACKRVLAIASSSCLRSCSVALSVKR